MLISVDDWGIIITFSFFSKESVRIESEPLHTVVPAEQTLSLGSKKSLSGEDDGESLLPGQLLSRQASHGLNLAESTMRAHRQI